jgi:hypothetical protein
MSLSLKIIGYYNHFNAGDEQYKTSIDLLFSTYLPKEYKYTIDFYDCDKINDVEFSDSDIIIVGGGDVLNMYFIDKVYSKFNGKNNLIIALSVGIPYINMLVENQKLNIIDYIFLRTRMDLEMFYKYIGKDRVFYLPDLSILLTKNITKRKVTFTDDIVDRRQGTFTDDIVDINNINNINNIKNKKIATICLSRNIYNEKYSLEYYNVIYNISKFVEYLIDADYYIIFLPFNTKNINSVLNRLENDILIGDDVGNLIDKKRLSNVTFIKNTLDYNQLFDIFKITTLCIPMRFHATLFSLYFSVPIIPIYTTRKVDNLLKEVNWKYSCKLSLNDDSIPTTLNLHELIDKYKLLIKSDEFIKKTYYYNINSKLFSLINITTLMDIICKNGESNDKYNNKVDDMINDLHSKIMDFSIQKGYTHYKNIKDKKLQNTIVSIVSYHLTSFSIYKNTLENNITINSIYNFGLKEKMFNKKTEYDYKREWRWIVNDILHKCNLDLNSINKGTLPSNDVFVKGVENTEHKESLFNIEYMDQIDRSGAHRSGWRYVYDNITPFNNKENPLYLDLYVDRTFHWNKEINKIINIIPYKKPWVGFIHHTFDTTFSDYNCNTLLNCSEFIDSLSCCKGIFVLSKTLKEQFIERFKKDNINVPVYSFVHPTECNVSKFSCKSFVNNKDKKVIHIGGWLRNIYLFYSLQLPKTIRVRSGFFKWRNDSISKVVLKGKDMNNYYPRENFMTKIKNVLSKGSSKFKSNDQSISKNIISKHCSTNIDYSNSSSSNSSNSSSSNSSSSSSSSSSCSSSSCSYSDRELDLNNDKVVGNGIKNNWYNHFYNDLYNKLKSITIIEHLENEKYDNLLTENIVFINLVDASAVNTLIECIIRETPIIINKVPAVVELLGEKYPLYFGENDNICDLLKNDSKICKAHKYLKKINKEKFYINTFIIEFKNKLGEIHQLMRL